MMQPIIEPIALEALEAELTPEKRVRKTHYGERDIYITDAHQSPNLMQEIGRLREISFREQGGGTGESVDIDEFDTAEVPFKQLVVWCPKERAIVGGYRYLEGKLIPRPEPTVWESPTAHLFQFTDTFAERYLPEAIELGRSFIQPAFQAGGHRGVYSLDNLWDGLGAIISRDPSIKYFFGKVTMYPSFNPQARDLILYFMRKHFPDTEGLMQPYADLFIKLTTDDATLAATFNGENYREDYKILVRGVKALGAHIPPLVNAYMNLSPSMKSFGTAVNPTFGAVEETGILITIRDIYDSKRDRHL